MGKTGLKGIKSCQCDKEELTDEESLRAWIMRIIVEGLTGIRFKDAPVERLKNASAENESGQGEGGQQTQRQERAGFGLAYDRKEVTYEAEKTKFEASGKVTTADGREIRFDLKLEMEREYYSEENVSVRIGDAIDPLVINFTGNHAELEEERIEFDLDVDGAKDSIPFLKAGSGFLVLDKNKDGIVNDGSELFGPQTGNGFEELAKYDEDGNGWIDEADAVYAQLLVWSRVDGGDILSTLSEKDVGAIYLGNTATDFDLKGVTNDTLGQIRSSSVYLAESGGVGTVQHIDIVV
jgi:hypothetical protein